ncbi:hypothetical protein DPMN_071073 [Dreissena polymorpha]|uniref:Uncharacterized protein n=1 Tax=Dreissena polymorpha TaxID=45954 RepID=A0A9D3Z711_DREPO|nr:hypothetical protein DPMN_071073 [Dreissena polymorpha]
MRDDNTEILIKSGLFCAVESNSSKGRDAHIVQPAFLLTTLTATSLKRALLNCLTQGVMPGDVSNQASFHIVTIARRGSCGQTRLAVIFRTYLLVLCSL